MIEVVKQTGKTSSAGYHIDASLRLDPQIKKLKATTCHKLRNISNMKPFLCEIQLQYITLANKSILKQLQSLENHAGLIIKDLKEYVSPHIKSLHWLKLQERIEFKVELFR